MDDMDRLTNVQDGLARRIRSWRSPRSGLCGSPRRGPRGRVFPAALALALVLAACTDTTVGTTGGGMWEGALSQLDAAGDVEISGTVTLSSRGGQMEAKVVMESDFSNEAFGWEIGTGTCEAPEGPIGRAQDFGFLEVDASGHGSAQVFVPGGGFAEDATFAAAVFPGIDDRSEPIACAELRPVDDD